MKLDVMPGMETWEDARLVALGVGGDREAFGELVARYQSPVCALAYSACGNIARSEDLAQETFVIAWRKLGNLKEPVKFKSWLFGIVRNRIHDAFRQQTRDPLAASEPLDENLTAPAPVASPTDRAISKEEEEILWRSLEQIPGDYREPLVLFYREHQSIQRVAAVLELSEETVRQRLSRGRKLLQERVTAFVEGALQQTAPGPAFTLSVLSALPALMAATGPTAAGGAVLKSGTAGKAVASAGLFSSLLAPILWFCGAVAGTWAMTVKFPDSLRERKFVRKTWGAVWIITLLYILGAFLFVHSADWQGHYERNTLLLLGSTFAYVAVMFLLSGWVALTHLRIRKEEMKRPGSTGYFSRFEFYEYRSPRTLLGLPLVHVRFNRDMAGPPAKGWIAIGTKAYGIIFGAGAIAVGLISWGALAFGVVALGGVGAGLLGFGGMALGLGATGGLAVGYVAFGGGAIAWLGAAGGVTIAHHFAVGGGALAQHANDPAAQAFMQHSAFFRYAAPFTWTMISVSWLYPLLAVWFKRRLDRKCQQD
jgi:RNA polymerase sigma factor (sigma-70 family)